MQIAGMLVDFENKDNEAQFDGVSRNIGILVDIMKEFARATVRAVVGSDERWHSGWGWIHFSFPEELPVRVRARILKACPGVKLKEADNVDCHSGAAKFSLDRMTEALKCFLSRIANVSNPSENSGAEENGSEELACVEGISEEEAENTVTPIETLDLSVRSYNCLMRAGIKSVEALRKTSDADLIRVRNLGRRSYDEIKEKLDEYRRWYESEKKASPREPSMSGIEELNELIGLEAVKEQVRKLTAFAKMKKDLSMNGNNDIPMALNMEFSGNPGTAKTTVARILARIFHEIGITESDEMLEVGRADLVAKYVGQTAVQVRDVFRQAKGKLLFIDEAYSLVEAWDGEFGDEAINTIVKEMEDNREDTIVIFAGYPDKMKEFFSRNPGLRSRVPFTIHFKDYSLEEMVEIGELEARRRGFAIDAGAKTEMMDLCREAMAHQEAGNGRFCRNLIENAILEYAARVYGEDGSEKKDLILIDRDFSFSETFQDKEAAPIGF